MNNLTPTQLANLVNDLLYLGSDDNASANGRAVRDHLLGAAATANTVINAASGGVPQIGPPKKRVITPVQDQGEPSIVVGYAYSGGVIVIGPPKKIDALVADLIDRDMIPVQRAYLGSSAWVEWRVPAALRMICLSIVAAQFEDAKSWAPAKIQDELTGAVNRLLAAAFG